MSPPPPPGCPKHSLGANFQGDPPCRDGDETKKTLSPVVLGMSILETQVFKWLYKKWGLYVPLIKGYPKDVGDIKKGLFSQCQVIQLYPVPYL